MKIALAHTPFVWPSSPPLGISLLKSYISARLDGVSVQTFDLNAEFFTSPPTRSLCRLCPKHASRDCIPPDTFLHSGLYKQAQDFLSTPNKHYFDPRKHIEHYLLFRTFYEQIKNCYFNILNESLKENVSDAGRAAERLIEKDGEKILDFNPDMVGLSVQNDQSAYSIALARWIKRNSKTPVVIGGWFPSFCDPGEILNAFPFIDTLVRQEGEKPLTGLIASIMGKSSKPTPGIARICRGKLKTTKPEPEFELDAIPHADFADFDMKKYWTPYPVLPIAASRGCSWGRCAFCSHRRNYHENYRERSAGKVAEEIAYQKDATGAGRFLFCDEQITGRRLEELSEAVRGADVRFGLAGLKPDKTITRNRLKKAYDAGCRWVYLGAESFSQRLLNLMDKGLRVEDSLNAIRNCREAGIVPFVSYIWGFPTQKRDDLEREKNIIFENRGFLSLPDDGHPFVLEKHSPVFLNPKKYDIEILDPEILLGSKKGNIHSGRYFFRQKSGLTPFQAQSIYRPANNLPYLSHSFWEALILLAEKTVELKVDRAGFFDEIVDSPYARMSQELKKPGARDGGRLFKYARCVERLGKHTEAAAVYEKLLSIRSAAYSKSKIKYRLGISYEKSMRYEKAMKCFESLGGKALSDIDRQAALYHTAVCKQRLGLLEEAIELHESIEPEKSGRDIYLLNLVRLGACLAQAQRWHEAEKALQRARALDCEGYHSLEIGFFMLECATRLGDNIQVDEESKKIKEIM